MRTNATLLCLCALTVRAAADDQAKLSVDLGSSALWSSTGWGESQYRQFGEPRGAWQLEYKHWWGGLSEPPNWSRYTSIDKPTREDWSALLTREQFTESYETDPPNQTWMDSGWHAYHYADTLGLLWARTQTRARANADPADLVAQSRTRLRDPFDFVRPDLDANWPTDEPIDPDGTWRVGGLGAMFGSFDAAESADSGIGMSFWVSTARAGETPADTHDDAELILSIDATSAGPLVWARSDLLLTSDGAPVTTDDLLAMLAGAYTPQGWSIDPTFSFDDFDASNPSHLAEVFDVAFSLNLDSDIERARLFTERRAAADAHAPAPATLAPLSIILATRRRRRA